MAGRPFALAGVCLSVLLPACVSQERPPVSTGLDVLAASSCQPLEGKTVGVITNQTGVDRDGRHVADIIQTCDGVVLAALFGPEHGIRGSAEAGERVSSRIDSATGLPVHSLYGEHRKPAPAMLEGLDALVFDIQDVGARFYTYISTMALAMEAAAAADIEFFVLDRPNPLGDRIEGPVLEPQHRSFVGVHPIALRHGMTAGELAKMFLGEKWIFRSETAATGNSASNWEKLHVIPMQGWQRHQLFEETGLTWIAPSPNMPTPATALVYPGMCLLEATNFSEGRGTERPFELVGAPWLDAASVKSMLQSSAGVYRLVDTHFVPEDLPGKAMNPKFEDMNCRALEIQVMQPREFESVKLGVKLLRSLHLQHPTDFEIYPKRLARLAGVGWLYDLILQGVEPEQIERRLDLEALAFRDFRQKYLLYN